MKTQKKQKIPLFLQIQWLLLTKDHYKPLGLLT